MDHIVEVLTKADGTLHCGPDEVTGVRRGDRLIWGGLQHSGAWNGKILGPKQSGFVLAELHQLAAANGTLDGSKFPTNKGTWSTGDILVVRNDAEPGSYKYTVTVPGKGTVDPVIILDL
jgi:hypothetical protein